MTLTELDTLIFFVTSQCNSKRRTCFYWEALNQEGDLGMGEIEQLSSTMPSFNEVWLSGGEPTLRAELPDIVELFYRQKLKPLCRHYADRLARRKGFFGKAAYLGILNLYHEIQAANLDRHHRWPMPCTAARNIAVVDANGDVRSCELRERLGNLRDYDLDWRKFWSSPERREEIEAIRRDGCLCTHVCFIHASLKASKKAPITNVPRAYLNQRESKDQIHVRASVTNRT